jgi:sugar/nucleoside kinase (ribokinase family)
VTLGLNSIDLVALVEHYPPTNSKQRLEQFAELPGGQMATAAAVCARLGWRARYVGSFGSDRFAAAGRQSLVAEGVDVAAAWDVPGATSQFAIVIVDRSTGERTVIWNRHPGLAIAPGRVPREAVTSGRVLLVDCHETAGAAQAARYARAAGIPTVVDVEKVRDGIADLLREIDVILAAQQFPSALTGYGEPGRAIEAMAREFGAPLVAVTLGDEGSLAWYQGREVRTPAFPVACVDTTGAGDAFHGGFVAGWLRNPSADVSDLLEYANAVAALNCRGLGARGGMPTPAEVDDLIARARRRRS